VQLLETPVFAFLRLQIILLCQVQVKITFAELCLSLWNLYQSSEFLIIYVKVSVVALLHVRPADRLESGSKIPSIGKHRNANDEDVLQPGVKASTSPGFKMESGRTLYI